LLYVASELGIADALPGTGPEVAERVGADPGAMTRALRGLALEGIVSEQDARFTLTELGGLLPSFAGALRARGELYYRGAVEAARAFLGDRASCVVGDFFEGVPAGADAYLLSRVLHDWDDENALRIRRVVREAMSAEARLLVVDAIPTGSPAGLGVIEAGPR
jgi:hypothetical protein